VLERIDPIQCFTQPWRDRLGMSEADFEAALASVDPDGASGVGGLSVRTGILSNSADGARREEQARYQFEQLVDVVVYSHEAGVAKPDPRSFRLLCEALGVQPGELVFLDEMPGHIDAARALGIHGIVHVSTPDSIAAVEALMLRA
jgi:HAD superfamily hydrolase (TIGR01509 family)